MTESEPDRNGDPKVPPPASTEWSPDASDEGGDLPLPPFFAGSEESAPMTGREPAMAAPGTEEPADTGTAVEDATSDDQPFPFEDMGGAVREAPGATEPSLEEEAVTAHAAMPVLHAEDVLPTQGVPESQDIRGPEGMPEAEDVLFTGGIPEAQEAGDDFPVEAFHLPERNLVDEPVPAAPDHIAVRAVDLADRLDRLAGALRSRGTAALTEQLAGGDRFDALLTGLLAGFLAAGDE